MQAVASYAKPAAMQLLVGSAAMNDANQPRVLRKGETDAFRESDITRLMREQDERLTRKMNDVGFSPKLDPKLRKLTYVTFSGYTLRTRIYWDNLLSNQGRQGIALPFEADTPVKPKKTATELQPVLTVEERAEKTAEKILYILNQSAVDDSNFDFRKMGDFGYDHDHLIQKALATAERYLRSAGGERSTFAAVNSGDEVKPQAPLADRVTSSAPSSLGFANPNTKPAARPVERSALFSVTHSMVTSVPKLEQALRTANVDLDDFLTSAPQPSPAEYVKSAALSKAQIDAAAEKLFSSKRTLKRMQSAYAVLYSEHADS